MKQVSPARLTRPLLRKAGGEGAARAVRADFGRRAFGILEDPTGEIRAVDQAVRALHRARPSAGADQHSRASSERRTTPRQLLLGQHGAGMITIGGSFWEIRRPTSIAPSCS
jgi:hypothetical protein